MLKDKTPSPPSHSGVLAGQCQGKRRKAGPEGGVGVSPLVLKYKALPIAVPADSPGFPRKERRGGFRGMIQEEFSLCQCRENGRLVVSIPSTYICLCWAKALPDIERGFPETLCAQGRRDGTGRLPSGRQNAWQSLPMPEGFSQLS